MPRSNAIDLLRRPATSPSRTCALARAKRCNARRGLRRLSANGWSAGVLHRQFNRFNESVGLIRLFDEIDCARFHGADRSRHIGLAAHDNHGQLNADGRQSALKLESVHFRHLDIEQKASLNQLRRGVEAGEGGRICIRRETCRLQQPLERATNGGIVIHDMDNAVS